VVRDLVRDKNSSIKSTIVRNAHLEEPLAIQLHQGNIGTTVGGFYVSTWPWHSGEQSGQFLVGTNRTKSPSLLASPTSYHLWRLHDTSPWP
jgi:hypothetical protein